MRWGLLLLLLLLALPQAGQAGSDPGLTHALLINGGSKPASNYLSHLNHLQEMVEVLLARGIPRERIHVFSADGEDAAADLAVRDTVPEGFWLVDGTRLGKRLRPRTEVTNTRWPQVTLQPATRDALAAWFEVAGDLLPGDRLLIFVTDHGSENPDEPDNGSITLWGEELTVEELKGLLGRLTPGVQTVMVMSQCYSGTFAAAIYDDASSEPTGDACGFFSTTRDRKAYGCYPEGRDRDRIGHAFRFIDALGRQATAAEAHLDVLLTDSTPDVPVRTSELYLERLLADEAAARGRDLDALVDELLAAAWRDRAAWEPEIRLLDRIGETFGTFSPRSLAELERYEENLPPLAERLKDFAGRWSTTLTSVKEEALRDFVADRPGWGERLATERIQKLDGEERAHLLASLLPELEGYLESRPDLRARLDGPRDKARLGSEARWRLEVREAALRRLRSVLVGVAGEVLLADWAGRGEGAAGRTSQRRAFDSLRTCEAFEPGKLPMSGPPSPDPVVESFPPLAEERRLLDRILPSWLGVRFGSAPEGLRADRELAVATPYLQAVYPESPAADAELEIGDLILGPPGEAFSARDQLREWTMTSPRGTALELRVLRPGPEPAADQEFVATVVLRPLPVEWPELPEPPQVGDRAPALPDGLRLVGRDSPPELDGRPHLLFFWATWCLPCKKAVPEVLAFAAARGIAVLAITDEDPTSVARYLDHHGHEFFDLIATDPLRRSFISYGVSGTPTIVLVGEGDKVLHRQVGYSEPEGLTIPGWELEKRP